MWNVLARRLKIHPSNIQLVQVESNTYCIPIDFKRMAFSRPWTLGQNCQSYQKELSVSAKKTKGKLIRIKHKPHESQLSFSIIQLNVLQCSNGKFGMVKKCKQNQKLPQSRPCQQLCCELHNSTCLKWLQYAYLEPIIFRCAPQIWLIWGRRKSRPRLRGPQRWLFLHGSGWSTPCWTAQSGSWIGAITRLCYPSLCPEKKTTGVISNNQSRIIYSSKHN